MIKTPPLSEKWGFEFMPWRPLGLDYQVIDSKSEYQNFFFNVKGFGEQGRAPEGVKHQGFCECYPADCGRWG
jgi:hypothetical protein